MYIINYHDNSVQKKLLIRGLWSQKNKKKTLNLYNHIGGREIQQGTQEKTSMKTSHWMENGGRGAREENGNASSGREKNEVKLPAVEEELVRVIFKWYQFAVLFRFH